MLNKLVRLYICIFAVSALFVGCSSSKKDSKNITPVSKSDTINDNVSNDNASEFSEQQLNYQIILKRV